MAASKQGQKAMTCQLCEETFEVKWQCLTCQFFMCTRCCKIHEKFKSSDRHNIVNIRDRSAIREVKKDFSNIKCEFHNGQSCCLFCQRCEELVCLSCVAANTHNSHKMLEFTEGNKFMLNKLKERKTKLENENENKASHLKSLREKENSIYEKERKTVLDHSKVLKEAVDNEIERLLDDLKQHWNKQDKHFEKEESRLEVEKQEKKKRIEILTSTISSQNPDDVIKTFRSEKELTTEQTEFPKFPKLPRFKADGVATAKIISACGILKQGSPEVMSQTKLKFKIEREIQLTRNTGEIFNILVNDDESVWINDTCSKELFKLALSETCQFGNIQNSFNIKVFDMAKTEDGDLLLSTQKPELRIIPKTTGQIKKSHIRVDNKLQTAAIRVTHDNKILIGVITPDSNIDINLPSNHGDRNYVQMMNAFGEIENVYEFDNDNRRLFSFPVRIASDDNNNIYVMDIQYPKQDGRIVIISRCGEIRGIYSGHPMLNKDCPLTPKNIVPTKFGSIIVSDKENHMVHILNTKGQCIQYQKTKDLGIAFPFAMAIDEDILMICAKSTGKWVKDKILAVKLS